MPDFTAIFWNIQDMGKNGQYRYYTGLMNFIAAVALAKRADVLAVMEVRRNGVDLLGNLRAALNEAYFEADRHHDWHFDWIPAALASGLAGGVVPTAFHHLAWESRANSEGYAVFWNDNDERLKAERPRNAMSGGVNRNLAQDGYQNGAPPAGGPDNLLELVTEGRRRGMDPDDYDENDLPNASPIPPAVFEPLNFLTNVSNIPRRNATRRPCYCTFRLRNNAHDPGILLTLLLFHAPGVIKFRQVAAVGTRLYSFSRPLFNVATFANPGGIDPARVVAGGDLNLNTFDGPAYLQPAIRGFTNTLNHPAVPGAACVQLAPAAAASNSTIRLATGGFGLFGAPIASANSADYLAYAIDNVFHRGFAAGDGDVDMGGDGGGDDVDMDGGDGDGGGDVDMGGGDGGGGGGAGGGGADGGGAAEAPIYDLVAAVMEAGGPLEDAIRSFAFLFYAAPPNPDDPAIDLLDPPDPDLVPVPPHVQSHEEFLGGILQGWFPTARSAAEFVRLLISDHLPVVFRGQY